MVEQQDPGRKRERSPEYPAFDLEEALSRAKTLYEAERRNAAPIAAVLKHWGLAPKSGGGLRAVSSLEKFGLVANEGSGDSRKVRLTDEGFRILVDERPDSPERIRLIQEAALRPTAHAELWSKYGKDLPSESTLMYELRTRGFISTASAELIREYRSTLAFAKLDQDDTLTGNEEDKLPPPKKDDPLSSTTKRQGDQREQGMTVLSLQVSDRLVELAVPGGPMTKGEIGILRKYLEVQELIAPDKREDPPPISGDVAEHA